MSTDARARALSGAAALAASVVLPGGGTPDVEADASYGVLHGLYWLVAGLAADHPQLLVVDDLHWADDASVRFLEFLANRLEAVPALLVAARRPPASPAQRALGGATVLALAPLSRAATAAVLAERDGRDVTPDFAGACHDATGGNPLLVRRLAEGLPAVGDVGAIGTFGPDAVLLAVEATLARLGPGPVRLARAVAILDGATLATAGRLAALDHAEAARATDELVRAGVLRDTRPLVFEHALVRDAVMRGTSTAERARLHEDAARLLRDAGAAHEVVAVHLLRTDPAGDPEVAATLASAGQRALASGALEEAIVCLARAVAEPPPAARRVALSLDLARAEHGLGRPEALDRVLEAFAAARDPEARAEAALALAWATGLGRQDPADALAMVDEALAGVQDRELGLRLEALRLAVAFMDSGLLEAALGSAERFADLPGRTRGECELLAHVALHRFLLGRSAAEVAEPLERAVADPAQVTAIGSDSVWLLFALGQLLKTDRLDLVATTARIALADAQRRGSAPGFAVPTCWVAWVALRRGDAAAAEADARAAHEALAPEAWQRAFTGACLAEVLVEGGRLAEAQAVLDGARETAADRASDFLLYASSILRLAQGDAHGALADQLGSRERRGNVADPDPDFDGWLRVARLRRTTGDPAGATREAAAALAWARVWDTPASIGQALTVTGLLGRRRRGRRAAA